MRGRDALGKGLLRVFSVGLLTFGVAACGGDADTPGEALDDAVAGAQDAMSDFADATQDFMDDRRSDMEDLAATMDEAGDDVSDWTRDHWNEARDQASRLGDEISDDMERLRDATGDEAEAIQAGIEEKQHEMARWVHEAKLAVIDDKDDFVEYVSEHTEELGNDIQRLEEEAEDSGSEGLDDLRSAYDEAMESLSDLGDATGEEFHEAKRSLSSSLANLRADVDRRLNSGG